MWTLEEQLLEEQLSGTYEGGTWGTTFDPVFVAKWVQILGEYLNMLDQYRSIH